jgi:hypothetical protein
MAFLVSFWLSQSRHVHGSCLPWIHTSRDTGYGSGSDEVGVLALMVNLHTSRVPGTSYDRFCLFMVGDSTRWTSQLWIRFISDRWCEVMTVGNLVKQILFQWAFVESIPTEGCSNCHHGGVIAAVIPVEDLFH